MNTRVDMAKLSLTFPMRDEPSGEVIVLNLAFILLAKDG